MRYCIHEWSNPALVGLYDARWTCRRCGETRLASGDQPMPGTFVAASEAFSNAVRNLGLAILDALPRRLRP